MSEDAPIKLTPRLEAAARTVRKGAKLVDVGTDHAYLPVYLVQTGVCPTAVAADIRSGPLQRAEKTVEKYGLKDKISLCLCDGVSGVSPDDVQDVVICGMGGETICMILSQSPWLKNEKYHFVLQPMTKANLLREFLCEEGYEIEYERAAREDGRIYCVMSVFFTGRKTPHDDLFCYVGKLCENMRAEERDYLKKLAGNLSEIARGLRESSSGAEKADYFSALSDKIKEMTE